ncbi:MAG: hypothetical protein WC022_04415 [Parcubacteria group bacterium]
MKIKLLLVPSIITLIVILSIWLVYPAYSNGSTGVKDHYTQLQSEKAKLDSILGKSDNASKLSSQLDSLGKDGDVVYEFIPSDIKESEIIDNLNRMAADSGLLIYGLSVGRPSLEVAAPEAVVTMGSTSLDPANPSAPPAVPILPKPKNFEANIQVSGNYDQIKNFLGKVDVFARYDNLNNLILKKGVSSVTGGTSNPATGTDTTALDVLTANVKIGFNLVDKATLSGDNVNDPVFSGGSFDTGIISQIKSQRSGAAMTFDIGQKGKANPFMP